MLIQLSLIQNFFSNDDNNHNKNNNNESYVCTNINNC